MGQRTYTPGTLQVQLPGSGGSLVKEPSAPEKPPEPLQETLLGPWAHLFKEPRLPPSSTDRDWTGRGRKALSRGTGFRAALGLAALLFIIIVGLAVYIVVLKGSQRSEQFQTKGAQSDTDGRDVDVLPPCGDSWIWYRNKCYYFSEDEGTWTEAKDWCAALGSSLALIDTQQELDFMLRYKGHRDHWIGLQRETDQHWKWVNGTEFSDWFAVEDFSECAYLNHGRVKSGECYSKSKWICTKVST